MDHGQTANGGVSFADDGRMMSSHCLPSRVVLQHAFFPPTYANATPTPRLRPGDMRMWTGMKGFIELRDGVSLLIPFREASKVSMVMRYVPFQRSSNKTNRTGNGMARSTFQTVRGNAKPLLYIYAQATAPQSAILCL